MNLVTEPWLPVTNVENEMTLISLNQLFKEPEDWIDLVLRPHEKVSVMRFLLCITQASLNGPADIDEFNDALLEIPKSVLQYLRIWGDHFDLYHPTKPFLQIADLELANKTSTPFSKLDFALATGSNSTLFDHSAVSAHKNRSNRSMSAARLAISMLTFNNFSLGGLYPQAKWGKYISPKSGVRDARCATQSMLHCFVRKESVLKTLHANIFTKEQLEDRYGEKIGKPIWEMFPASYADQDAIENATKTYLGRLVPLSRFLKILPDSNSLIMGEGFIYPVFPEFIEVTSAQVIVERNNKKERAIISGKSKAPWRELNALSLRRKADGSIGGPAALENVPAGEGFDLIVLCLKREQATVLDTLESVLHVPASFSSVESITRKAYQAEIKYCETSASRVVGAIEAYLKIVNDEWKKIINNATQGKSSKAERSKRISMRKKSIDHFWTLVEKQRYLLTQFIELLGSDKDMKRTEAKERWRKIITSAVNETYQTICSQNNSRQVRAYVTGWKTLYPNVEKANQFVETEEV